MAIEYRDQRDAAPGIDGDSLTGRAIPFDSETQIGPESWGFKEKFNRNAFNKTLKDGDTALLNQHDSHQPIARTSAGTLTLTKRNGGLEWDSKPTSQASYIADVMENVRAGNYGGCSVGFEVVRDAWTDDKGEPSDQYEGTHREVLEAKLPEVSLVTFPAYKDTNVQQNSAGLLGERRAAYEAAQGSVEDQRAALQIDLNAVYGTDPHGKHKPGEGEEAEEPSSPDETAYDDGDDEGGGAGGGRSEELPEEVREDASEENGEPVTTTREQDDEYETALRMVSFHELGDLLSRMSDLED